MVFCGFKSQSQHLAEEKLFWQNKSSELMELTITCEFVQLSACYNLYQNSKPLLFLLSINNKCRVLSQNLHLFLFEKNKERYLKSFGRI